jgi:hypothetical protein
MSGSLPAALYATQRPAYGFEGLNRIGSASSGEPSVQRFASARVTRWSFQHLPQFGLLGCGEGTGVLLKQTFRPVEGLGDAGLTSGGFHARKLSPLIAGKNVLVIPLEAAEEVGGTGSTVATLI